MIRAACDADVGAVAALWNEMIRDTLFTFTTEEKETAEIARLIAARPEAFWIADIDGEVTGFMTFGPFRAGPGYATTVEHSIVVAAAVQGQGIAEALMDSGEEAAMLLGHHVMIAAISGANPRAIRFHETRGYIHVGHLGEVGRKRGQWLDLILMQKILP